MKTHLSTLISISLLLLYAIPIKAKWETGTSTSGPKSSEILVIDFTGLNPDFTGLTGLNDSGPAHALGIRQLLSPNAPLLFVGFRGDLANAKHDITVASNAPMDKSVAEIIHALTNLTTTTGASQAVIGFDIRETGVPQQLRGPRVATTMLQPVLGLNLLAGIAPALRDQIATPANLAAQVVLAWQKNHPFGKVILRGHSDGTWAILIIHDVLVHWDKFPSLVVLGSPRQQYDTWADRASRNPATQYVSITSNYDLPGTKLLDTSYSKSPSKNWINFRIDKAMNVLQAHSIVTNYELRLPISINGERPSFGSLGALLREQISNLPMPRLSATTVPPDSTTQVGCGYLCTHRPQGDALGGIDLSVAQAIEKMDNLDRALAGATVDSTNGVISFLKDLGRIAPKTTIPRHEILYTALALRQYYGDVSNIAFSLEPTSRKAWEDAFSAGKSRMKAIAANPEEARDELIRSIRVPQRPRYEGAPIERTAIGHILLHADMALKSSTMGYDYRTGERFFISEEHRRLVSEAIVNASEAVSMARFWFYLDECKILESDRSFRIGLRIRVKTTGVDWRGADGTFRDTGRDDPHLRALTSYIGDHLGELAERFPVINDLEETYRLLLLVEALRRRGVELPDVAAIQLNPYDDPDVVDGMAVLHLAPAQLGLGLHVGGVLISLGQRIEAVYSHRGRVTHGLETAFDLKPSEASFRRSNLYAAGLTKDLGRVVSAYDSMDSATQKDPYALMLVARAYLDAGNSDGAAEYARRGLESLRGSAPSPRAPHVKDLRLAGVLEDIQTQANLAVAIRWRERTATLMAFLIALLPVAVAGAVSLRLLRKHRSGRAQGRTPGVEPSETELSHAANAPAQSGRKPVRLVLGADGVFKKINDEDNQS